MRYCTYMLLCKDTSWFTHIHSASDKQKAGRAAASLISYQLPRSQKVGQWDTEQLALSERCTAKLPGNTAGRLLSLPLVQDLWLPLQ